MSHSPSQVAGVVTFGVSTTEAKQGLSGRHGWLTFKKKSATLATLLAAECSALLPLSTDKGWEGLSQTNDMLSRSPGGETPIRCNIVGMRSTISATDLESLCPSIKRKASS